MWIADVFTNTPKRPKHILNQDYRMTILRLTKLGI